MIKQKIKAIFALFLLIVSAFCVLGADGDVEVVLSPDSPSADSELTCRPYPNGHYTYFWYKNNVEVYNEDTEFPMYFDLSAFDEGTSAGDRWKCEVQDRSNPYLRGTSNYVVIDGQGGQNEDQIEVIIIPNTPLNTDDLECHANPMGHYNYIWEKNSGSGWEEVYNENYPILSSDETNPDDIVRCTVQDRVHPYLQGSYTVQVGTDTTPPTHYEISVLPDPAYTNDDLRCEYGGGSGHYTYEWWVNGIWDPDLNGEPMIDSSKTSRGDLWKCIVTDRSNGNQVSDYLVVQNSRPTITQPTISPLTAYTDTDLTCTAGTPDDDDPEDVITVKYEWLKNNVPISGQTSSDLSSSNFGKGDKIVCRTTPNDGEADGDSVDSAELTISNSIPQLDDLPDFDMDQGTTITKDYSSYAHEDKDGDTLTLTDSGANQVTVEITDKSVKYTAPDNWDGDETITFTLSDGEDSVTDDVTVTVNPGPVVNQTPVANFTFSPSSPVISETINFTDHSYDPDGDTINHSWDFGDGATSAAQNPTHSYDTPGTYDVVLTVSDGERTDSMTKQVTVTAKLSVDSISCMNDLIAQGESQSCTVRVSAEGQAIGGATVKVYFTDDTDFGTCTTDDITGACSVQKTMDNGGTFTIYATAKKSRYESDLDKQPQATFQVLIPDYEIVNLKTYNDDGFSVENSDFFRGEDLYVKFQVIDKSDNDKIVTDAVTRVTLVSPVAGGMVNLSTEQDSDNWYYYSLKPIPTTHDFIGDSQIFTFAFNFVDGKIGQKNVSITIRNNLPKIEGTIPKIEVQKDNFTTRNLSGYKTDVEDSGSDLNWSVTGSDDSIFTVSVDGDTLTVNGIVEGNGTIDIILTDLDGDTATQTIDVEVKPVIIGNPPTIEPIPDLPATGQPPVLEDELFTYQVVATDLDGDNLTYSLTGPAGMVIHQNGTIEWTPTNDQVGVHTVTVFVDDGSNQVSATFTITVTNVNDAPVADFDYLPLAPRTFQPIIFTDKSTDEDSIHGDTLSHSWDFGDGATSTEQNPTHNYSTPGIYSVRLTVTDSEGASNSTTKTITVISGITVTLIDCFDNITTGGTQSCSVYVESESQKLGEADVKLHYIDDSLIGSCTTDSITGACSIQFTAGSIGSYTVYATAEKAGYEDDMDKDPTETFNVLAHRYDIVNLKTYNDDDFETEDSDFFRGEDLYVKFQVIDLNNGNAVVEDIVTAVELVSPPGGRANLVVEDDKDDGWYYYSLKPIPTTHEFKGDSQIFTFAFNFSDSSMGQSEVQITIRNNPPTIEGLSDITVSLIVPEYTMTLTSYGKDKEDSPEDLEWSVVSVDNESIATAEIKSGNTLAIKPRVVGETQITLTVKDIDGDSAQITVNLGVMEFPGAAKIVHAPKEQIKVERIRLPARDIVKAGDIASFTFSLRNNGDFDSENVRITATVLGINHARRRIGPFKLDIGEEVTKDIRIDIPDDAEPGKYDVRIDITSGNRVKRTKFRMLKVE